MEVERTGWSQFMACWRPIGRGKFQIGASAACVRVHAQINHSTALDVARTIAAAMPKLVIAGIPHEVVEPLTTIGRAPDNTIILDEPSVSSHHAQIERSGDAYRLTDLQSTNGTRVNGVQITDTTLRAGDRIRFGGIDSQYEPDAPGSEPLPDVDQITAAPAESSAAPIDFANASPFPLRRKQQDRARTAVFAAALIAFLAFLASVVAILNMHAPVL